MKIRIAGVALALSASLQAYAVDDAAFARCRGISDSTARLACYDGLPMGRPPSDGEAPPIAPPRTSNTPPAAPAGRAAAPAPVPPAAQAFGLEERAPRVELASTMESYIPGHFDGWGPNTRIKLGNGQVWQVTDGSSAIFNRDNPKVLIRRGMMGGFFLEVEDSNRSPRVRRLQ